MNIDYRKVFLALIAAVIISIPTASALQTKTNQIESERQQKSRLQIDIQKKSTELEKLKIQTKESDAEKQRLKQENEQLQKDLQAKRERKAEEARLAAAQASQPAAVSSSGGSCRAAIAQVWGGLQSGAITVMTHENRAENPQAVGSVNFDGSQDFGCFQINNKAHAAFFANNDWRDPVANATYALQIYQERARMPQHYKNGWTAWYAVQGILW